MGFGMKGRPAKIWRLAAAPDGIAYVILSGAMRLLPVWQLRREMDIINAICFSCESGIEFPRDFENVICPKCGAAYHVREYKGAVSLSPIERKTEQRKAIAVESNGSEGVRAVELRLSELDELVEAVSAEIETLRSREQAGPLQAGCAFFGIFGMALIVIAVFMTVGKSYFGGWLFYMSLAAVVLLGLMRMRSKMAGLAQVSQLREERVRLETGLGQLEEDRNHLENLREKILSKQHEASAERNGD